jgi:hypothetical protein
MLRQGRELLFVRLLQSRRTKVTNETVERFRAEYGREYPGTNTRRFESRRLLLEELLLDESRGGQRNDRSPPLL